MLKTLLPFFAAAGATIIFSSAAHAGLIHEYNFSNSSGVIDTVGNANGTLINGASISGGTLNLNSANSEYVQFNSYLVPTGNAYSIEITASGTLSSSAYSEMISQGSSGGPGLYIGTTPSGAIRLGDTLGTTGVVFPTTGLNTFLFSSSVSGGSDLWINGSLAFQSATYASFGAGGTDTRLGAQFGSFGEYFNGAMSSVLIFDTAVTPATATGSVPEPSTWAMVLAGLASLWFIGYRSSKQAS